jgi:hypothetical protein
VSDLFGIIGVFDTPEGLRSAAAQLQRLGFRSFEAYTPYPVEGSGRIVHPGPRPFLPILMFVGAIVGAAGGYWIQYWDEAVNYPLNVGGRPHNSWPAFTVGTFEFMLLLAVFFGFVGFLAASGLPRLYHPLFEAKAFQRASRDRFVICIEANDPAFDTDAVHEIFARLGAERIEEVRA